MNNTILAILHTLNILAFVLETATEFAVRVIALAIVLGEYIWTGAQVVYNNRQNIMEDVNIFRDNVGSYFVYGWYVKQTVPIVLVAHTFTIGTDFVYCINSSKNTKMQSYTDPCTMALENDALLMELFTETPGEIFDVEDEEKFNVESYINGNTDYWYKPPQQFLTCFLKSSTLKLTTTGVS